MIAETDKAHNEERRLAKHSHESMKERETQKNNT